MKDCSTEVQVWDTAGQERFRTITPIYYKNVHGVILVYDSTNKKSFEQINYWMENLNEHANPQIQKTLVAAKIDKYEERQVSSDIAKKFALDNDL